MLWAAWLVAGALAVALSGMLARAGRSAARDDPGWRGVVARLHDDRVALLAVRAIIVLGVLALLAPWLAPYSPVGQPDIVALKNLPPSLAHPFGTDFASRDVLSRVLYGARVSLAVAVLAIALAVTLGTAWGATAGYYGGRLDEAMMRLIDAALSVPRILVLIAVLVLWGGVPLPVLVLLLGFTGWFGVSRVVRGQVLALREQEMVLAARALGARDREIIRRHILPNVLSPVIVAATLGIANLIIVEAGLSYLGIGVRPPTPSWGNMIQDGAEMLSSAWWVSFFPGLAVVLTVMAFNLAGDGLRDAAAPHQVDG
ncbi:MAG TPA: ABC transporter permease [Gemmatimonadaceae bacterium]